MQLHLHYNYCHIPCQVNHAVLESFERENFTLVYQENCCYPQIIVETHVASTTTPTPEGLMAFSIASAISLVSLS